MNKDIHKAKKSNGKVSDAFDTDAEKQVEEIDYKDKYLRALADYQNLLKRVEKDKIDFVNYANARLIEKLLDVLDDFERAHAEMESDGVGLIYKKLTNILKAEGVEQIEIDESDEFNPEYMQCIEAAPDGDKLEVIRKGYQLKGKVVRVAQVKVIK